MDGLLIDIRLSPWSQRACWRRPALEGLLGGRYRHLPMLGNRNFRSGGPVEIVNLGRGLDVLSRHLDASPRPLVLLCACARLEGCHRRSVAEALWARGVRTEELPGEGGPLAGERRATLAEFAGGGRVLADALVAQGIDTAFLVPGESYLDVLDGLYEVQNRLHAIT